MIDIINGVHAQELVEAEVDLAKLVKAADQHGKQDKKAGITIEKWLRAGHCQSMQQELCDAVPDGNVEKALVKHALGSSAAAGAKKNPMKYAGEPYEAKQPIVSPFA